VQPLVNGATYFAHLTDEVQALHKGDHLFFTDWRGDADEQLIPTGPTIGELFGAAAQRGVIVKGLMWHSHSDGFAFSGQENRRLGEEVHAAGAHPPTPPATATRPGCSPETYDSNSSVNTWTANPTTMRTWSTRSTRYER
jgi:hypothetical protein